MKNQISKVIQKKRKLKNYESHKTGEVLYLFHSLFILSQK